MKRINLDISHRCTLECSKCLRQYYKSLGMRVPGYDMTVEEYRKIIAYFKDVRFCGNVSDPVFNPNFIDFLKLNFENDIVTRVHHAATGKSLDWYKKAFEANPKAIWIFGIDGLPEDSHKYRVNQDGVALFEAMKLCRDMGLISTWAHLIFKYNEKTMDSCRQLANDNNIPIYFVKSSRFEINDPLRPENKENYL